MRSTRRSIGDRGRFLSSTFLFLLLTIFSTTMVARADDADDGEDYDVKARVVRISLITGKSASSATATLNGNARDSIRRWLKAT